MADIRINSLPSTATSTASDDFIAIDGATNGTRKMSAFNPVFSGTSGITATDVILGSSGPSVKSTLSARAPRQGLVFDGTAGATTSVTVGSGDFTACAIVNPTTFSEYKWIFHGGSNAFGLFIDTSGKFAASLVGVSDRTLSTGVLTAGKNAFIAYVKSGNTGTYYIDGIAAGTTTDSVNYSGATTKLAGTSLNILVGTIDTPLIYNRALSSSEVVALYEAGAPAGADYPSQVAGTALITGDNSTFASNTGFWTQNGGASITGGKAVYAGGANSYLLRSNLLVIGSKYRMTLTISNYTSGKVRFYDGTNVTDFPQSNGTHTIEHTARATALYLLGDSTNTILNIDDVTLAPIGLLLAPDAYQAGGGLSWYDTSGNSATITLPASGVTWNVPSSQKTASGWTFGGNLTVAGTVAPASVWTGAASIGVDSTDKVTLGYLASTVNGAFVSANNSAASAYAPLNLGGTSIIFRLATTETARFAATSGNLLLGTTTDSSNGKLQLATHTTSSGGIGFGTDTSLYRYASGILGIDHISGSVPGLNLLASGVRTVALYAASNNLYIDTFNAAASINFRSGTQTTALTLDSSQNATFAGQVNSGTSTSSGYNNNKNVQLEGLSGRAIVNHNSGTASGSLYIGFGYNGSGLGSITQDSTTGVLYNTTSDARLKTNVRDLTASGAIIDALLPRIFDWKSGDKNKYGFIAQEVFTVFPQAVKQGDDGEEITDQWAMDASKLVPVLVAEIKSLRSRLAAINA